jgi:hypothetical protein
MKLKQNFVSFQTDQHRQRCVSVSFQFYIAVLLWDGLQRGKLSQQSRLARYSSFDFHARVGHTRVYNAFIT